MNYNQFTKAEIIQKIINVEPNFEKLKIDLFVLTKEMLLNILDKTLTQKVRKEYNINV